MIASESHTGSEASNTAAGDWADRTEQALLNAALPRIPALGFSRTAVLAAGAEVGLSPAECDLLLPYGAQDLAALYARRLEHRATDRLVDADLASQKIREKIRLGLTARLDAAAEHTEVTHRWAGFLALPGNLPLALRLVWDAAEAIWRAAGDTATDENHYSKRAIVSGILMAALVTRLTQGEEAADRLIDERIGNVMAFEKWKASQTFRPDTLLRDLASQLGALRFKALP